MSIVDIVKWNATERLHAWKFPSEELSTKTQLIVAESQEAVLLRGGQMLGPFKAGRHTLDTENIPGLVSLVKLPFGGRSPFSAEVWFVNKMIALDVKWGTGTKIQVQDPMYDVMLPIRAHGQYGVRIEHTKKFLNKLVGTLPAFDQAQLASYFRGLILTRVKDVIANYIVKQSISVLRISAHLNEISDALQERMSPELDEFGVRLVKFLVHSIDTPEDDPAVVQMKSALSRRAELNILGTTYETQRSFETMDKAAEGGGPSGLVGAGVGLGVGLGMGNSIGSMTQQTLVGSPMPCPQCQAPNAAGSAFCGSCGGSLRPQEKPRLRTVACPGCGAHSPEDSKFCCDCGQPLRRNCPKCNAEVAPGVKFCSECGTPTTA